MRVSLAKHGGHVPAIYLRLPPQIVDTDVLPEETATELVKLVAAAKDAADAGGQLPGSARDAMSYTVTVSEAGTSTSLTQSDAAMSEAFAALLEWIEEHSPGGGGLGPP